eukprot:gene12750-8690_t
MVVVDPSLAHPKEPPPPPHTSSAAARHSTPELREGTKNGSPHSLSPLPQLNRTCSNHLGLSSSSSSSHLHTGPLGSAAALRSGATATASCSSQNTSRAHTPKQGHVALQGSASSPVFQPQYSTPPGGVQGSSISDGQRHFSDDLSGVPSVSWQERESGSSGGAAGGSQQMTSDSPSAPVRPPSRPGSRAGSSSKAMVGTPAVSCQSGASCAADEPCESTRSSSLESSFRWNRYLRNAAAPAQHQSNQPSASATSPEGRSRNGAGGQGASPPLDARDGAQTAAQSTSSVGAAEQSNKGGIPAPPPPPPPPSHSPSGRNTFHPFGGSGGPNASKAVAHHTARHPSAQTPTSSAAGSGTASSLGSGFIGGSTLSLPRSRPAPTSQQQQQQQQSFHPNDSDNSVSMSQGSACAARPPSPPLLLSMSNDMAPPPPSWAQLSTNTHAMGVKHTPNAGPPQASMSNNSTLAATWASQETVVSGSTVLALVLPQSCGLGAEESPSQSGTGDGSRTAPPGMPANFSLGPKPRRGASPAHPSSSSCSTADDSHTSVARPTPELIIESTRELSGSSSPGGARGCHRSPLGHPTATHAPLQPSLLAMSNEFLYGPPPPSPPPLGLGGHPNNSLDGADIRSSSRPRRRSDARDRSPTRSLSSSSSRRAIREPAAAPPHLTVMEEQLQQQRPTSSSSSSRRSPAPGNIMGVAEYRRRQQQQSLGCLHAARQQSTSLDSCSFSEVPVHALLSPLSQTRRPVPETDSMSGLLLVQQRTSGTVNVNSSTVAAALRCNTPSSTSSASRSSVVPRHMVPLSPKPLITDGTAPIDSQDSEWLRSPRLRGRHAEHTNSLLSSGSTTGEGRDLDPRLPVPPLPSPRQVQSASTALPSQRTESGSLFTSVRSSGSALMAGLVSAVPSSGRMSGWEVGGTPYRHQQPPRTPTAAAPPHASSPTPESGAGSSPAPQAEYHSPLFRPALLSGTSNPTAASRWKERGATTLPTPNTARRVFTPPRSATRGGGAAASSTTRKGRAGLVSLSATVHVKPVPKRDRSSNKNSPGGNSSAPITTVASPTSSRVPSFATRAMWRSEEMQPPTTLQDVTPKPARYSISSAPALPTELGGGGIMGAHRGDSPQSSGATPPAYSTPEAQDSGSLHRPVSSLCGSQPQVSMSSLSVPVAGGLIDTPLSIFPHSTPFDESLTSGGSVVQQPLTPHSGGPALDLLSASLPEEQAAAPLRLGPSATPLNASSSFSDHPGASTTSSAGQHLTHYQQQQQQQQQQNRVVHSSPHRPALSSVSETPPQSLVKKKKVGPSSPSPRADSQPKQQRQRSNSSSSSTYVPHPPTATSSASSLRHRATQSPGMRHSSGSSSTGGGAIQPPMHAPEGSAATHSSGSFVLSRPGSVQQPQPPAAHTSSSSFSAAARSSMPFSRPGHSLNSCCNSATPRVETNKETASAASTSLESSSSPQLMPYSSTAVPGTSSGRKQGTAGDRSSDSSGRSILTATAYQPPTMHQHSSVSSSASHQSSFRQTAMQSLASQPSSSSPQKVASRSVSLRLGNISVPASSNAAQDTSPTSNIHSSSYSFGAVSPPTRLAPLLLPAAPAPSSVPPDSRSQQRPSSIITGTLSPPPGAWRTPQPLTEGSQQGNINSHLQLSEHEALRQRTAGHDLPPESVTPTQPQAPSQDLAAGSGPPTISGSVSPPVPHGNEDSFGMDLSLNSLDSLQDQGAFPSIVAKLQQMQQPLLTLSQAEDPACEGLATPTAASVGTPSASPKFPAFTSTIDSKSNPVRRRHTSHALLSLFNPARLVGKRASKSVGPKPSVSGTFISPAPSIPQFNASVAGRSDALSQANAQPSAAVAGAAGGSGDGPRPLHHHIGSSNAELGAKYMSIAGASMSFQQGVGGIIPQKKDLLDCRIDERAFASIMDRSLYNALVNQHSASPKPVYSPSGAFPCPAPPAAPGHVSAGTTTPAMAPIFLPSSSVDRPATYENGVFPSQQQQQQQHRRATSPPPSMILSPASASTTFVSIVPIASTGGPGGGFAQQGPLGSTAVGGNDHVLHPASFPPFQENGEANATDTSSATNLLRGCGGGADTGYLASGGQQPPPLQEGHEHPLPSRPATMRPGAFYSSCPPTAIATTDIDSPLQCGRDSRTPSTPGNRNSMTVVLSSGTAASASAATTPRHARGSLQSPGPLGTTLQGQWGEASSDSSATLKPATNSSSPTPSNANSSPKEQPKDQVEPVPRTRPTLQVETTRHPLGGRRASERSAVRSPGVATPDLSPYSPKTGLDSTSSNASPLQTAASLSSASLLVNHQLGSFANASGTIDVYQNEEVFSFLMQFMAHKQQAKEERRTWFRLPGERGSPYYGKREGPQVEQLMQRSRRRARRACTSFWPVELRAENTTTNASSEAFATPGGRRSLETSEARLSPGVGVTRHTSGGGAGVGGRHRTSGLDAVVIQDSTPLDGDPALVSIAPVMEEEPAGHGPLILVHPNSTSPSPSPSPSSSMGSVPPGGHSINGHPNGLLNSAGQSSQGNLSRTSSSAVSPHSKPFRGRRRRGSETSWATGDGVQRPKGTADFFCDSELRRIQQMERRGGMGSSCSSSLGSVQGSMMNQSISGANPSAIRLDAVLLRPRERDDPNAPSAASGGNQANQVQCRSSMQSYPSASTTSPMHSPTMTTTTTGSNGVADMTAAQTQLLSLYEPTARCIIGSHVPYGQQVVQKAKEENYLYTQIHAKGVGDHHTYLDNNKSLRKIARCASHLQLRPLVYDVFVLIYIYIYIYGG